MLEKYVGHFVSDDQCQIVGAATDVEQRGIHRHDPGLKVNGQIVFHANWSETALSIVAKLDQKYEDL